MYEILIILAEERKGQAVDVFEHVDQCVYQSYWLELSYFTL